MRNHLHVHLPRETALGQRSETVSQTARAYSEMGSFSLLIAFQRLKITCFKQQCLKTHTNDTFFMAM